MGNLSEISNVTISLQTAAVQGSDFGTQMIASPHASSVNRVLTYLTYDSTNPDNLPPATLSALSAAFSQTPHPASVKVGRLSVDKVVIAPVDAVAAAVYSLRIAGTLVTVTAAASPTTSTIATQLATAINTAALGVTATAVAGTVELVFAGGVIKPLTVFSRIAYGAITSAVAAGAVAADLGAIFAEDSNWFILNMTERTKQRQIDAAAWAETQDRMFVTASSEATIYDPVSTTDLASVLKTANYFRTVLLYSDLAATEYPDVAWTARMLTIAPGGDDWANKQLAGVSTSPLTATQKAAILAKNANTYESYNGISLTNPGKTSGGEWADIIRFRDWLKNRIQVDQVQLLINRDKIPYTDSGLQLIGTTLKASLRAGQEAQGIAPDETKANGDPNPGYVVQVPLAANVSDATKATRIAYLKFSARIAGAIHMTVVTGSLAYSLN